jgi:ABC-type uncharacterized transport system ATPase subunit
MMLAAHNFSNVGRFCQRLLMTCKTKMIDNIMTGMYNHKACMGMPLKMEKNIATQLPTLIRL